MSSKITEVSHEIMEKVEAGEISQKRLQEYQQFLQEVNNKLMKHSVITNNQYCIWFAKGDGLNMDNVKYFIQQFSVFSHLFLVAQLKKMIFAGSVSGYRASKEILANEIGVIFRNPNKSTVVGKSIIQEAKEMSGDPEIVSTEGTVDGGVFKFDAGHFEWLYHIGETLGLNWNELGKPWVGSESTLHYCNELERLIGSTDWVVGEGSSFAIENWAAAGFWKQLISGLQSFKKKQVNNLRLAFFTFHDAIEDNHAGHVQEELAELFFKEGFDKQRFLNAGVELLNAVQIFWDGLYKDAMNGIKPKTIKTDLEATQLGAQFSVSAAAH